MSHPRVITYTVIDFECTGVVNVGQTRHPNEPWQIGLVDFTDGKIREETAFETFLRIGERPVSPHTPVSFHKYRDQIRQAPTLPSLWKELKPRLLKRPLVAHNIATEKNILHQAVPMDTFGPWIDTLTLARALYPQWESHTLEDCIRNLKLEERVHQLSPCREYHDAMHDTFACAVLLDSVYQHPALHNLTPSSLSRIQPTQWNKRKS